MTPIQFLRQRAWRPGLLCCEPAMAWLAHRGVDTAPVRNRLMVLWRRHGIAAGGAEVARRLGLAETTAPRPGDVVLVDQGGVGPAYGLCCGPLVGLVAADTGRPVFARLDPLKAWRVP